MSEGRIKSCKHEGKDAAASPSSALMAKYWKTSVVNLAHRLHKVNAHQATSLHASLSVCDMHWQLLILHICQNVVFCTK